MAPRLPGFSAQGKGQVLGPGPGCPHRSSAARCSAAFRLPVARSAMLAAGRTSGRGVGGGCCNPAECGQTCSTGCRFVMHRQRPRSSPARCAGYIAAWPHTSFAPPPNGRFYRTIARLQCRTAPQCQNRPTSPASGPQSSGLGQPRDRPPRHTNGPVGWTAVVLHVRKSLRQGKRGQLRQNGGSGLKTMLRNRYFRPLYTGQTIKTALRCAPDPENGRC